MTKITTMVFGGLLASAALLGAAGTAQAVERDVLMALVRKSAVTNSERPRWACVCNEPGYAGSAGYLRSWVMSVTATTQRVGVYCEMWNFTPEGNSAGVGFCADFTPMPR